MKILIVNLYAHTRSTGKIAYGLLTYLRSQGHEVKLCCRGTREAAIEDEDIIKLDDVLATYTAALMTRITGIEGLWNYRGTNKLIRTIEEFKPQIVQLYSLHGFYINHYKLIEYLKNSNIPCVYSMIDEFPYMGKCPFSYECVQFKTECKACPSERWKEYPESFFFDRSNKIFNLKKKAYNDWHKVVFTGPKWVQLRALSSALLKNKDVRELDEPIDYKRFMYPRETEEIRSFYKIPKENRVILTVSDMRYWRKGGKYFLQLAEMLIKHKDLTFVAVGYNKAVKYPVPNNTIPITYVSSQEELATLYSLADLFVCVSLADTMPNVCLDALGCGTPLAGFAECGTPYCAEGDLGKFTQTYDMNALADVVLQCKKKDDAIISSCVNYAHNRFSSDVVFKKLTDIYNELIN